MKMHPLEPAGEDLLRRAKAHSVAEREYPIAAERLFAMFELGETWSEFFPVIRKVEWTSPRPFDVGTTRTVTIDDIIAVEGERVPAVGEAQKNFRIGFIFLVRPGSRPQNEQCSRKNSSLSIGLRGLPFPTAYVLSHVGPRKGPELSLTEKR